MPANQNHIPNPQTLGLEGEFALRIAHAADYRRLARFHYTRHSPATYALVVAVDHLTSPYTRHPIAVGVLSNPTLNCKSREQAMQLGKVPREWRYIYLNRHLRTISRIIVHPQYRGIGLSSALVRFLLRQCPTRYIEAISHMATHHPLFSQAGMTCINPGNDQSPAYFLFDQLQPNTQTLHHTQRHRHGDTQTPPKTKRASVPPW